jgi:hypothetical protein
VSRRLGVVGIPVGAVLAALAAVRRGKPVHPRGEVYAARLVVGGVPAAPRAASLFARAAEHRAVVRFSRSLGLPRRLSDLLGMSIRVLDAYGPGVHQDFLLVTSVDAPVLHHIFVPASDVRQRPYSSSLLFRAGGERFIVGALPDPESARRFLIAVARPMGRFVPVADLWVEEPLPEAADALRFRPLAAGGGLEPAGVLNAMRRYAYPMSQWAWGRAKADGARLQREADRLVERGSSGRPG